MERVTFASSSLTTLTCMAEIEKKGARKRRKDREKKKQEGGGKDREKVGRQPWFISALLVLWTSWFLYC